MATNSNYNEVKKAEFTELLLSAIHKSEYSQSEIAQKLGYTNANIVTMFKQGRTRVPLEKVTLIAEVLHQDKVTWLRLWFEAFEPDAVKSIEDHLGIGIFVTDKERSWLKGLRKLFKDDVPTYNSKLMA
jgi:transcriptional regulator with XRE-family HTH domain